MNVNRVQFLTYKALFPVQTTQTTAEKTLVEYYFLQEAK
jgi:hypothetical protein